jgi:hypothetical protein
MTEQIDWMHSSEVRTSLTSIGLPPNMALQLAKDGWVRTHAQGIFENYGHSDQATKDEKDLYPPFWNDHLSALDNYQEWATGEFSHRHRGSGRTIKAFGVHFSKSDLMKAIPSLNETSYSCPYCSDLSEGQPSAAIKPSVPSNDLIAAKMQELIDMGMKRDVAAKVIRQVAGFEQVGNELARNCVAGQLPRGRPKKMA